MNGKITIGDSSATHDPFHTLVLSAGDQETGVSVSAVEGNSDFILVWFIYVVRGILCADMGRWQAAGEPLDQEVVQYGPFVMTTREEIQKTFMDCKRTIMITHGTC